MTPNKTVDAQKALAACDKKELLEWVEMAIHECVLEEQVSSLKKWREIKVIIEAALQSSDSETPTAAASKPNPVEEVDWLKRGATVHVNGEPCEVLRISEDSGVLLSRFGWKCRTLIDEHKAAASEVGVVDPYSYFHLANGYPHNKEVDWAIEYLEGDGKHTSFDDLRIRAENILLDHAKAICKEALSRKPVEDAPVNAQLLEALKAIVDMEVETAESGDHGFYDPEKIPQVIQARAAIAAVEGEKQK
jgi:hypothetical protein